MILLSTPLFSHWKIPLKKVDIFWGGRGGCKQLESESSSFAIVYLIFYLKEKTCTERLKHNFLKCVYITLKFLLYSSLLNFPLNGQNRSLLKRFNKVEAMRMDSEPRSSPPQSSLIQWIQIGDKNTFFEISKVCSLFCFVFA